MTSDREGSWQAAWCANPSIEPAGPPGTRSTYGNDSYMVIDGT